MCRCYFCYTRGGSGSKVLMCLYDLEKAYDSVEYPVLHVGDCLRWVLMINGKLWRVMKNWYSGRSCFLKVDGKWGRVLNRALFYHRFVMDPLFKKLQDSSLGLFLNSYYAGLSACR